MTVNEMRNNPPEGCRVYRYTFPNGMIYIGQTKRYLYLRYLDKYKNKRLMDAFAKYGWENTKKEILIDGLTKEQAMKEEIKLIGLYDACNPNIGYNISRGGNLGFSGLKHTEETKKKCLFQEKVNIVELIIGILEKQEQKNKKKRTDNLINIL